VFCFVIKQGLERSSYKGPRGSKYAKLDEGLKIDSVHPLLYNHPTSKPLPTGNTYGLWLVQIRDDAGSVANVSRN
jgi:hypothetical protein